MDVYFSWIQSHLLAVVAVGLTLILSYHYLIEKDTGVKLSKKYRNSIFEAQSKIFLNATQYLISGNKNLAIREFLNAVDLNRETIETYFALGGLFRSNGEIDKAISIHRSLIARDNISESIRLQSLKELAIDFDKGGFIDKAIDTYQDVLKINRDQSEVIKALCRIYEDIEDWDQAYNYRMMLSKVSYENQSETVSHILIQKAKGLFEKGEFLNASEEINNAFKYAPSVSAKILWIKLALINGDMDRAKSIFVEVLNEHPLYTSFMFVSFDDNFKANDKIKSEYQSRLKIIKDFFLKNNGLEYSKTPSVILAKIRLLKEDKNIIEAYELLKTWISEDDNSAQVLTIEFIKLAIELDKFDVAIKHTQNLLLNINKSLTRHFCKQCGFNSDEIFWRCPQCHEWETIQFRWKV